jgi:D-alanine-D-alanine ligase
MRVLVLHSDIAPDAPPDEQDTLEQAAAIAAALERQGHGTAQAAFAADPAVLRRRVVEAAPDAVFNVVEAVWGRSAYAAFAAQLLSETGVPFTGSRPATIAATGDKLLAKRLLSAANLPTAPWCEPPEWRGIGDGEPWIVKAANEDASIGLDDFAIVTSRAEAAARAQACAARHGGPWFAERYLDGREFNIAVLERDGAPFVLPIAEMRFEDWEAQRPRIVGYTAKWDESSADFHRTSRSFAWQAKEPALRRALEHLTRESWALFGCRGYVRVDVRLDAAERPHILEVNANPCLSPDAGFAAAAKEAGLSYDELIAIVLRAAR